MPILMYLQKLQLMNTLKTLHLMHSMCLQDWIPLIYTSLKDHFHETIHRRLSVCMYKTRVPSLE